MSLKKLSLALAIAMAITSAASAAETKIGAEVFLKYGFYNLASQANIAVTSTVNQNAQVDRMRFVAATKLDDVWSFKFVLNSYAATTPYVEYGFAKAQIADWVSISFGIIPVVELATIHSGNGMRWLDAPLIYNGTTRKGAFKGGNASGLMSGTLGVRADFDIAKIVKIAVQVDTGESQGTLTEVSQDKSLALNIGIMPVKGLYIGLFGRVWIGDQVNYAGNDFWYAGAGVRWTDQLIKVGTNWAITNVGADYNNAANIWTAGEVFVNVNLASAINVPLLVLARVNIDFNKQASDASTAGGNGSGLAGMAFSVGLGYQFNKNVQVAVLYRGTASKTAALADVLISDLTIQSEVKF